MNLIYGIGWLELVFLVPMLIIILFPVWAIIDIVSSEFKGNDKLMWIIIVLFLPFAGPIIYFTFGRRQKIRPEKSIEFRS